MRNHDVCNPHEKEIHCKVGIKEIKGTHEPIRYGDMGSSIHLFLYPYSSLSIIFFQFCFLEISSGVPGLIKKYVNKSLVSIQKYILI